MGRLRLRVRHRGSRDEAETATVESASSEPVVASNRSVTRLAAVASESRGGPAAGSEDLDLVERPAAAEEPAATGVADVGTEFSIVVEREMPGHGFGPGEESAEGEAPATTAASGGGVDITINFVANDPVEEYRPAEEIASAHERDDAVGWTTPAYSINGRSGSSANQGTIDVTLDFTVELAEEFEGRTMDVLRDHETGHVNIATATAQVILVDLLESQLEALPVLTPAAANPLVNSAGAAFEFWEGTFSWLYDKIDYPRMRAAYLGARMTLDELTAMSPEIGALAEAVRAFAGVSDEPVDIVAEARNLLSARTGLSDLDLARVQYNEDFEQLVFSADETIARLLGVVEEESEAEGRLREVSAMLGDFSWEAPGSD